MLLLLLVPTLSIITSESARGMQLNSKYASVLMSGVHIITKGNTVISNAHRRTVKCIQ